MIRHRLGVRGPNADIDQRDARLAWCFQVIRRHLRSVTARRRRDELSIGAVRVSDTFFGHLLKAVDIELVVREQHEILEMRAVGPGIVTQSMQGIINPRSGEEGQRAGWRAAEIDLSVNQFIIHRAQIRRIEQAGEFFDLRQIKRAFDVQAFRKSEMDRHGSVGQTNSKIAPVV